MAGFFATVVAALRSALAYVGVSLWVLVLGPPGMLLAVCCRWPGGLYRLGSGGVRLGLAATGIRYRVAGREHIQRERSAVYCVNHSSNVEPPILYMALAALHPRLRMLYKAEIHRLPVLGRAFDVAGFVPIERRNREQSKQAIERAAAGLRAGYSFLVFPEGTRSRTGRLLPFKKGGFVMAIKGRAPVVPVAIHGARACMRKGSPIVRPVTVEIRIGPPLRPEADGPAERDRLIARTRAAVEALLAQAAGRSAADEERERPGR